MRPARLAVAPQQEFIVCFEKQDCDVNAFLFQLFVNAGEDVEKLARAYVDHERGQLDFSGLIAESDECRYELSGQVVYCEIAKIFKRLQCRGHPRPRYAGNDDNRSRHKSGGRWSVAGVSSE